MYLKWTSGSWLKLTTPPRKRYKPASGAEGGKGGVAGEEQRERGMANELEMHTLHYTARGTVPSL